jgi:hypothetical protein
VVIDQVNVECIACLEPENNTPVAGNIDCVLTGSCAYELMKPVARSAQVLDAFRGVEVGQNQLDLFGAYRADPAAIAVFEQALKTSVPEADDHDDDRCDK